MWWKILAGIGGLAALAAAAFLMLPIYTVSIKVDLPPAPPPPPACKSIALQMTASGDEPRLSLNGAPTSLSRLLLDMSKAHVCSAAITTVTIEAGPGIKYGVFMAVINELQAGG